MASVKCPMCGAHMHADSDDELVKGFKKHSKDVHDMELSDEEAKKKIKMAQEGKM
jgi:predicted small metal-binding protein